MESQADPTQAVDGLVRAMRDLTTDPNYKLVADVFSEFLFLKDRNDRLTTSHREVLDQHHKYRVDLDTTKQKLEKEKRELEIIIQEKVQEIMQLKAVRTRLEADLEDTNSTLDQERKNAAEAAENAVRELADLQAAKEGVEQAKREVEEAAAAAAAIAADEIAVLTEAKTGLEEWKSQAELDAEKAAEDIAGLQSDKAGLEEVQANNEAEIAVLTEAKTGLEEWKTQAELDAEKAAEDIAGLQSDKAGLEEVKANNEAEIASLQEAKTGLEEWKSQAELDAEKAAEDIAGLQSDKAGLEEVKVNNEAEIAHLQETIATLESEKQSVEEALAAANEEIASLQSTLETRNAEIESLQESMRAAEEQIASLQQTVEDKNNEIEDLYTKLTGETSRAESAITHGESLQSKLDETEATLNITSSKLADLEQYRIPLHDSNDEIYVNVLDKIWTTIVTLVEETFRPDIDADILADQSCWSNLRNSPYLKHATQLQIPLPQSNSPAAKGMRISAVLAVLSRALHKHVFRPVYLLEDDDENLVKFLRLLEDEDPTREGHMRSTLLSMMPERQMDLGARRVKTVVREISWLVQHLLGALQFEHFCSGLEAACRLACEQWMRIQQAQIKIEPYFGPPYDDFDWQVLELPEFSEEDCDDLHSRHADDDDTATLRAHQQDMDGGASVTGVPTGGNRNTPDNEGPLETVEAVPGNIPLPDSRGSSAAGLTDGTFHDAASQSQLTLDEDMEVEPEIDPDEILLVVWPSMCSVESGDLMSITQGLVISKEQARPALEEVRSRSRLAARPGSRRARTMSMPGQSRGSSPRGGKRESLLAAQAMANNSSMGGSELGSAFLDGDDGA